MVRAWAIVLVLALALVWTAGALAEGTGRAEDSFVVDGSAEIVKGNLAQARQEALSRALAAAVEQAAASLMGPEARPEAVRAWLPKPQGFVLSYRILSEGKKEPPPEAAPWPPAAPQAPGATPAEPAAPPLTAAPPPPPTYALRVEALVSLGALRRELRAHKLLPPEEDVLPPVAVRLEEAGGLAPERALALLTSALEQGGFRVRAAGKPVPDDLLVAARLRLVCTGAGCLGEAVLSVREGGEPGVVASGSGGGQEGEEGAALAFKAAAANLAARLRQPVPVAVCLKGLRHYRELAQVKAALEQMGLVARERSLQPGEIVLEVRVAGGARALSARLAGRKWTGFSLGRPEVQAGALVLSRLPAPAAP